MQKTKLLCDKYNLNTPTQNCNDFKNIIPKAKQNIKTDLINHVIKLLQSNRKLQFYSIFKKDTKHADLLNHIKNLKHKRSIAKFRIGNHNLKIETGRHSIPKTPVNLRNCNYCNSNEIEDETHFLLSCNFYTTERNKFFNELNEKYKHFIQLDNTRKIMFLFNNIDPIVCRTTAAFIYDITLKRKEHT